MANYYARAGIRDRGFAWSYNKNVIHRYILFNDQIRDSTEKMLTAGQVGLLAGWGVFSTLRVADGKQQYELKLEERRNKT